MSQFGVSLLLAFVVAASSVAIAMLVAGRAHLAGRGRFAAASRVLAVGAILATVVATALPQRWAIETDGDLVLALGGGGLRDWRILFDGSLSLASIQLVGNVLLYAAVGFTMVLGWFERRHLVIPVCVVLSVVIEAVQFTVLGRVAALDDVLLNAAGATIGYAAAFWLVRARVAPRSTARPATAQNLGSG